MLNLTSPPPDTIKRYERPAVNGVVLIEFDGGSACNIPRLGYGEGYGSYKIGRGAVHRARFDNMSANAAEIRTLATAIAVAKAQGARHLLCVGDSRIALKWANIAAGNRRPTKIDKTSASFKASIALLRDACFGIVSLHTQWQPRAVSVRTFGH
jgi:hypothetical protein